MRFISAIALTVLLASCGGGGGGGGAPPPPPATIRATFTPAATPGGAALLLSGPAGAQQGTIILDVIAQSLPAGTYGVAFDLDFNPALVQFNASQPGNFFETGGVANYLFATDPANAGKLIGAVSMVGASSGASGSGRVVSLRFNILNATGTSALSFGSNAAQNASGLPISNVTWAAGTLQLSRQ